MFGKIQYVFVRVSESYLSAPIVIISTWRMTIWKDRMVIGIGRMVIGIFR
jgi:hypothetical protein